MKKTVAFMMAIALLGSALPMTTLAANPTHPVAGISSQGYVGTEDNPDVIDLDDPVDRVNYGQTVYFPLLSTASSAVSTAKTAWEQAVKDEATAKTNYTTAQTAYNKANDALTEYNKAKTDLDNYNDKFPALNTQLTTAKNEQATANTAHTNAKTALENEVWKTTELDSGKWPAMEEAARELERTTRETLESKNTKVTGIEKEIAELGNLTTLTNNEASKKQALYTATGKNTVADAQTEVTTRNTTMGTRNNEWTTAKNRVTTTLKAYEAAQETNKYKYVYETDVGNGIRASASWSEGKNYAGKVEVVKKRVLTMPAGADPNNTLMRYIYFLSVKTTGSSSTQNREIHGKVTIKKTSNPNKFSDIDKDIVIELGYSRASDGIIPTTPAAFKEGDGFDAERDYVFEFDADRNVRFEVDTVGQGRIVLGFDTEYDEKIDRKYPNARLWYYNGNGASFNRVGKLYLGGFDDDDYYVYEVGSGSSLTRVNAEYDKYEEAYVISTRTLGRYVVSDTRLSTTTSSSSSSSSSSSGSGTGTGTGTGGTGSSVAPISPPASSRPYVPPVASSSTPPQSSSSSSEEPEEEEESEPEEELEDEDDIVEVIVDDDEVDGPEEKSGIPTWVWVLIITGLAAVPVGIGVVYYLQNRPLRRDFFNDGEGDYEDDYDDFDDNDQD